MADVKQVSIRAEIGGGERDLQNKEGLDHGTLQRGLAAGYRFHPTSEISLTPRLVWNRQNLDKDSANSDGRIDTFSAEGDLGYLLPGTNDIVSVHVRGGFGWAFYSGKLQFGSVEGGKEIPAARARSVDENSFLTPSLGADICFYKDIFCGGATMLVDLDVDPKVKTATQPTYNESLSPGGLKGGITIDLWQAGVAIFAGDEAAPAPAEPSPEAPAPAPRPEAKAAVRKEPKKLGTFKMKFKDNEPTPENLRKLRNATTDNAINLAIEAIFADKAVDVKGELAVIELNITESNCNVVDLTGNTNSDGDDYSNQELSERRAQAVEVLIKPRITKEKLRASGKGEANLVMKDGKEDKEASRRVEVTCAEEAPHVDMSDDTVEEPAGDDDETDAAKAPAKSAGTGKPAASDPDEVEDDPSYE